MTKITENDATLEWTPPDSDDIGGDVAQFFIDFKEENDFEFMPAGRVGGNINHFTCDFLQKGKSYIFSIKSKNAAGFSDHATILKETVSLKESKG